MRPTGGTGVWRNGAAVLGLVVFCGAASADGGSPARLFPGMKFGKGQERCAAHLAPYIQFLSLREKTLATRARRLGIAGSTRWQNAAADWRRRREIWTRASYCWPCFDKSDLERDWREAAQDRSRADKATLSAAKARAAATPGTPARFYADLTVAIAIADQTSRPSPAAAFSVAY